MIPLFDLKRQYLKLRGEILDAIDKAISSGRVILGENVERFEKELADFMGVECAVGVSSGTDALILAVKALNASAGEIVLTTPYTFIASASAASWNGALPAFVDVDPETMNMDLDKLEETLGGNGNLNPDRVKAVVVVHLFGRAMDLERIEKISEKYGIPIVEDVAQAMGAEWKYSSGEVKKAGSVGKVSILSFFPTKNLGTYGDGGAVLTNDEEMCEKMRMLRSHGSRKKYDHEILGKNARLDEIHAAILRVKLKYLKDWNEKRIEVARKYGELFESSGLSEYLDYPKPVEGFNGHVFHQFVVKFKSEDLRKRVIDAFEKRGIGYAIYYPKPLHLQKVFEYLGYSEGDFPVAEELSRKTLALPIFPEIRDDEIEEVVTVMKNAIKEG